MIRTILKKQMMELFSFLFQDKKKKENRKGIRMVLFALLYIVIFGVLGAVFYQVADMLCQPLVSAGMGWLYFALTGLIAIALGVFGSVFNTFASLYQAKDNELLLSMPVKPWVILFVRMTGVFAMGLLYELIVMVPVLMKYFMVVGLQPAAVVGSVLVTLLIGLFILTLSCVLGWCVAFISSKTKQKSIVVVILSLAFMAAYYYVYGMAYEVIQHIIANPGVIGRAVKSSAYPLYHLGLAAEGKATSLLVVSALVLVLLALVCLVLARSYMKIVTTNKGGAKAKYVQKDEKAGSLKSALLRKEMKRFLGSPNYMLNCGLGIVMMLIAAVVLLVKMDAVAHVLKQMFGRKTEYSAMLACVALCTLSTMNDMTAPSVSLEGKNIWLLQVFPVSGWQVLCAKLKLHLWLTLVPVMLLTVCVEVVLRPEAVFAILIPVVVGLYVLMMALLGLFCNLMLPNLDWTNEIVPIKQSMSTMLALFGGWAIVMALAALYFAVRRFLSPMVYLIAVAAVLLAVSLILLRWMKTRGARIFETL